LRATRDETVGYGGSDRAESDDGERSGVELNADELLKTIGILLSAGHDFDRIIDRYSFDQIGILAGSIMMHRVDMMNAIAKPLLGAMGVDYDDAKVDGPKTRRRPRQGHHRNADYADQSEKERAMHVALASLPVRVRTKTTTSDGSPSNG
jgi:hypothetical protein